MAQYNVAFSKRVRKDLRGLPKKDVESILEKVGNLADEPLPPNAKKLKGDELYRIRIGVYRVIYEIRDKELIVFVVKIGHRKDVYR
ncbi:MAG: type II toxin-antitoxin system RelE/ParE family toxin [Verrucomicrobiales bacterium]|nr:type II toxin-antitoxin system RelE/ParE family toxin [Verrucomicrobiales bacterium]